MKSTITPRPRQRSELDCDHCGADESRTWLLTCNTVLFVCCERCRKAAAIRFCRAYVRETPEEDERIWYAVQDAGYELTGLPTKAELAAARSGGIA